MTSSRRVQGLEGLYRNADSVFALACGLAATTIGLYGMLFDSTNVFYWIGGMLPCYIAAAEITFAVGTRIVDERNPPVLASSRYDGLTMEQWKAQRERTHEKRVHSLERFMLYASAIANVLVYLCLRAHGQDQLWFLFSIIFLVILAIELVLPLNNFLQGVVVLIHVGLTPYVLWQVCSEEITTIFWIVVTVAFGIWAAATLMTMAAAAIVTYIRSKTGL